MDFEAWKMVNFLKTSVSKHLPSFIGVDTSKPDKAIIKEFVAP